MNPIDITYELINELENSDIIKNIETLKKQIKSETKLIKQIDDFNKLKFYKNIIDKKLIESKIELHKNSLIKEYLHYENELYFVILTLNKKLKSLVNKKGCIR